MFKLIFEDKKVEIIICGLYFKSYNVRQISCKTIYEKKVPLYIKAIKNRALLENIDVSFCWNLVIRYFACSAFNMLYEYSAY